MSLASSITFDEALYLHGLFDPEDPERSRIRVATAMLDLAGVKWPEELNYPTAVKLLRAARTELLEDEQYFVAATISWGTTLFDGRPNSVKLIWKGMQKYPRLLVFGAGSMGKSYTTICFSYLDYERDPLNTTIKLCSTTAGHERANTFSNLVRLHRESAVPGVGYVRQGFIGLDKNDMRSSIAEVTIDKGDENKSAKLQGFHPLPRVYPHPKFGNLTRVRGVFDEAEDIADGLWKGEANMMQNMDDEMHVAIVAMWNPKRRESMAAQKAEPLGGWSNLDERADEYTSRERYHVVRLDARRCENVMQKHNVFPGLQTWQGFKELEDKGGADFDTFGKGIYPEVSLVFSIISQTTLESRRGIFTWARIPQNVGTVDMAEEGEDEAIYTAAKYGKALGFTPEKGNQIIFDVPRMAIQFEQQVAVFKQNIILMGTDMIDINRKLGVRPEWFGLDCTNSTTLRDWMYLKFGQIVGIKWGEGATELPILEESKEKASDLYTDVKTEMLFAMGDWAEFGFVAFSPHMDTSQLFAELSDLRYKRKSKTLKECETTREYKKRPANKSPDRAASAIMVIHVVRRNSVVSGGQQTGQRPAMDQPAAVQRAREMNVLMPQPVGVMDFSETSESIDAIDFMH